MYAPQRDGRPPQPVVEHVEPAHPSCVLIPWTIRNLATSLLLGMLRLSRDPTLDPTCPSHAPVRTSLYQSLPRSYCYYYCEDYQRHVVPDHRLHSIRDLQFHHHTQG